MPIDYSKFDKVGADSDDEVAPAKTTSPTTKSSTSSVKSPTGGPNLAGISTWGESELEMLSEELGKPLPFNPFFHYNSEVCWYSHMLENLKRSFGTTRWILSCTLHSRDIANAGLQGH